MNKTESGCCEKDITVETCFGQITKFSVLDTTSVKDLKLRCELEFAIPSDLQIIIHDNLELENTITMATLSFSDVTPTDIKTFELQVIPGLQKFLCVCVKGDIEGAIKGIQDKTNHVLNTEDRTFIAAFVAAGSRKRELLSLLFKSKEWFLDMNKKTQLSRRSLLHAAVAGGDFSCVVTIMVMTRAGGYDLLHFEDEGHETPLALARRFEKKTLIQLLEKYEEIQNIEKTVGGEVSAEDKTHTKVIRLKDTSPNDFDLTCDRKDNTQQKNQDSEISQMNSAPILKNPEKVPAKRIFARDPKPNAVDKKALEITDDPCCHTMVVNCRAPVGNKTLSRNGSKEKKIEKKNVEKIACQHEKQKKKIKSSQQNPKSRFRKSSLKLHIPIKKKNVKENSSTERQNSIAHDETGTNVQRTRARSDGQHQSDRTSPPTGTVPIIKIIRNRGVSARDHQVHSNVGACERLSPTTENLVTMQRPLSASSRRSVGSPTISRRLICGRSRSSTTEKDPYSSHSPTHVSSSPGFYFPHPPDSPLSSRRQSWSPSLDLVAKVSPILQRKFGSAYADLERPRSGSLKNKDMDNQSTCHSPVAVTNLPVVDYKLFESLRQDLPVQSLSAPSSPQSPRKLLPMKISQELEELHHRYFPTQTQAKHVIRRRESLPGNIGDKTSNRNDKDENICCLDSGHYKQGMKPFDIWLKEKEEQAARKHAFELAATEAIEKLADQTWSEIQSHGKTYEQWRREKEQTKSTGNYSSISNDHIKHDECHKKAMKYEEWLKKKDEEDLRREEVMRQEAELDFEETRRKREIESERKIAKLKKHDN